MEKFRIRQQLEDGKTFELSNLNSKVLLTYTIVIFTFLLISIFFHFFGFIEFGVPIYSLTALVLIFIFYLLLFSGSARITSDKIYINKVIGKTFIVNINELKDTSTINLGTIKLTTINFPNEDFTDKVVVFNTRSKYQEYDLDPETIIVYAKNIDRQDTP